MSRFTGYLWGCLLCLYWMVDLACGLAVVHVGRVGLARSPRERYALRLISEGPIYELRSMFNVTPAHPSALPTHQLGPRIRSGHASSRCKPQAGPRITSAHAHQLSPRISSAHESVLPTNQLGPRTRAWPTHKLDSRIVWARPKHQSAASTIRSECAASRGQ